MFDVAGRNFFQTSHSHHTTPTTTLISSIHHRRITGQHRCPSHISNSRSNVLVESARTPTSFYLCHSSFVHRNRNSTPSLPHRNSHCQILAEYLRPNDVTSSYTQLP